MYKKIINTLTLFFASYCLQAQNKDYNQKLADSLGADAYGMKSYIFVILKTGSNLVTDKEKLAALMKGHLDNIGRLAKEGKLVVAGPFGKNDKTFRGLFILNVKDEKEAEELLQTDPAVKEKVFECEVFKWYGSAALPMYLPYSEKITKSKF